MPETPGRVVSTKHCDTPRGKVTSSGCASLEEAEGDKWEFYPLAFTTFGAPGKETKKFLRLLSTYTANPTGFMRHMLTALDVAIQVGNARIAMAATAQWWLNGVW